MRLVILSDTHARHMLVDVPDGDVLIFCGDASVGDRQDHSFQPLASFFQWFFALPHKRKIFIAGNHDSFFERGIEAEVNDFLRSLPPGVDYLEDSGVEINGLKFYGSPVQPVFYDWAFNRNPERIAHHWAKIPENTDVLITHGPPHGYLDKARKIKTGGFENAGCPILRDRVHAIKPKLHCFGHIHSGYGCQSTQYTTFINASQCNEQYLIKNSPFVFYI